MRDNLRESLPARAVTRLNKRHPYCTMKNIKRAIMHFFGRFIPAVKVSVEYAEAKEAHAAEFDDGDVYNGHPFEWSRRPLPVSEATRLLEEHDAKQSHPDWDFQEILDENLSR